MQAEKKILFWLIAVLIIPFRLTGQNYYDWERHSVSTGNYNEIAPVMTRDGLVFMSDISLGSYTRWQDSENNRFLHVFLARKDEDGHLKSSEIFSENIHTITDNGPVSFNFNEDFLAFGRNLEPVRGRKRKVNPNAGIYFADYLDGEWTNIRPFEHNDPESMTLYPALDASGRVLIFASDRTGGFGGFDLYRSELVNGNWSKPVNLGPVINSTENEIYPFLHSSGRLYFSSNGHDNGGGYDLFYSEYFDEKWFRPVKLPAPFNSGMNDFTFYISNDLDEGFFSSNRRGSTDIYEFKSNLPAFEVCKQQVKNNYCYAFYEENTIILDTAVYQYQWDMGDGTRITAIEAEHCFEGPGDYLVQLNVVDKLTGIVEFNQAEYLVEVRKVIQPYITAPDTVVMDEPVMMDGTGSYFGDAVAGEYFWSFGDGEHATGLRVQHTFKFPGIYKVKLGMIEESEDPETAAHFCAYKTIVVRENE